jgi:hypothetical protein
MWLTQLDTATGNIGLRPDHLARRYGESHSAAHGASGLRPSNPDLPPPPPADGST